MARALVLLVLTLTGCHGGAQRGDASRPTLSGGDGLTLAHAVVLTGGSEVTNTDTEYAWIRQHVPNGTTMKEQALINHGNRVYDKLDVLLPDGSSRSYYFDITSGFGKLF
jgi:hypothetical protein